MVLIEEALSILILIIYILFCNNIFGNIMFIYLFCEISLERLSIIGLLINVPIPVLVI